MTRRKRKIATWEELGPSDIDRFRQQIKVAIKIVANERIITQYRDENKLLNKQLDKLLRKK